MNPQKQLQLFFYSKFRSQWVDYFCFRIIFQLVVYRFAHFSITGEYLPLDTKWEARIFRFYEGIPSKLRQRLATGEKKEDANLNLILYALIACSLWSLWPRTSTTICNLITKSWRASALVPRDTTRSLRKYINFLCSPSSITICTSEDLWFYVPAVCKHHIHSHKCSHRYIIESINANLAVQETEFQLWWTHSLTFWIYDINIRAWTLCSNTFRAYLRNSLLLCYNLRVLCTLTTWPIYPVTSGSLLQSFEGNYYLLTFSLALSLSIFMTLHSYLGVFLELFCNDAFKIASRKICAPSHSYFILWNFFLLSASNNRRHFICQLLWTSSWIPASGRHRKTECCGMTEKKCSFFEDDEGDRIET